MSIQCLGNKNKMSNIKYSRIHYLLPWMIHAGMIISRIK
jgi:hypothetical protein